MPFIIPVAIIFGFSRFQDIGSYDASPKAVRTDGLGQRFSYIIIYSCRVGLTHCIVTGAQRGRPPTFYDLSNWPQKSLKGSYHCVPSKRRWPSSVRRRIANPVTLWSRGFKSPPSRHFSIHEVEFFDQFGVLRSKTPGSLVSPNPKTRL